MQRLTRWRSGQRPVLRLVLAAVLLSCLLGASAPWPDPGSCASNAHALAVFDVANRAGLVQRIPGLVNGGPRWLDGALHLTVFACLPWSSIPTIGGPLLRQGAAHSLPADVFNIVVVRTASLDVWWFADVNLDGFAP